MKKLTGIVFIIFMFFLFMEILIGFPISLEQEPEAAVQQSEVNTNPVPSGPQTEQKMQGVHLVESQNGNRDWELFSESAQNSKAGGWSLRNVRVLFYNKERVDFIVTGDKGTIDGQSKNMKIEGNVTTKSSNGYIFQSDSVSYQSAERVIISPDAIQMKGPPDERGQGLLLTGRNLEAHVDENLMRISEKVSASKKLNDGKNFEIKSGGAEFSGKSHTAKFTQNVQIMVGSMRMEGPEAQFEYRPGVDILQSVSMKGGVRVSDMDKYATSDRVRFDPEQNMFTFNGRPRVVQNNDEIVGEQIVFIDGGKKVKVEKIDAKVEKK